jgi:hypothetical protein
MLWLFLLNIHPQILTLSTKSGKTAGFDKPKNGKSCYGEPTAACVITVLSKNSKEEWNKNERNCNLEP